VRVALLSYTFPRGMGYIGNMLPRYLARLGAEVHYITMDLPHYFQNEGSIRSYGSFEGIGVVAAGSVEQYDGFTLHGLAHRKVLGQMAFAGLRRKLEQLRPDVVQSFLAVGWPALQAALMRPSMGFRLFTANHTTASVFPMAQRGSRSSAAARLKNAATRFLPGRFISARTELCYAATVDCADVANRFFGVQREKTIIMPLGVDTESFTPVTTQQQQEERRNLRRTLGIEDDDVLFIYTGQFTEGKNPVILAEAVEQLRHEGLPVRALFIGDGPMADHLRALSSSLVRPFVPNRDLPAYYRAAEVGVWPTQESTSMLDAAACGLPIVVNDTLRATERIAGNGLTYRLGDRGDLSTVLRALMSIERRSELGMCGARRMAAEFSWRQLVERRLRDYERSLGPSVAAQTGMRQM
jgi:glycosyltransferase involved in cell wall biosynthesis